MPWHEPVLTFAALAGTVLWLALLALPFQPWHTRERLESAGPDPAADLSSVCVLIPARNEAANIARVLAALSAQGTNLVVVLIDDQSSDGTAEIARRATPPNLDLTILTGTPLPSGWAGKMWALEQGRKVVTRPLILLLDADITLKPGTIAALLAVKTRLNVALLSLMAELRMNDFWERLLIPAFIYFFKLVYPFALANGRSPLIAAAAGGCILIEREALAAIGGFEALRGALIDDCALARAVKRSGRRSWIGLSHAALSVRPYGGLGGIWQMVARTAFTQLGYSPALLLLCTVLMAGAFWLPLGALVGFPAIWPKLIAAIGLSAMAASYLPTLRYYGRSPAWALALPLIGTLYLAMTWSSAFDYWLGRRSRWKGRIYDRTLEARDR